MLKKTPKNPRKTESKKPPRKLKTPTRRDIGFGIHVTNRDDGLFIHFSIPGGRGMGFCVEKSASHDFLGRETLRQWAKLILEGHESLRPLE